MEGVSIMTLMNNSKYEDQNPYLRPQQDLGPSVFVVSEKSSISRQVLNNAGEYETQTEDIFTVKEAFSREEEAHAYVKTKSRGDLVHWSDSRQYEIKRLYIR